MTGLKSTKYVVVSTDPSFDTYVRIHKDKDFMPWTWTGLIEDATRFPKDLALEWAKHLRKKLYVRAKIKKVEEN